ncbi:hypothetical protein KIW84_065716, partial [Lathyrus oleraceus]
SYISLLPPSFFHNNQFHRRKSTMLSSRCLLFLLVPLFFTVNSEADDQLIFRYHKCNNDLGNYTGGSAYQNNLASVLKDIYSNREIDYGFYNFSKGEEEPDIVYAIGFCRGDIHPNDCRDCLKTSAVLLTDRCRIQKEAIGYYDICTLRYSNTSIFGVMDTNTGQYYNIESKTVVDDAFNQTLNGLLDELKSAAAEGDSRKKFDEKNVKVNESNSNNETIYGMVQCTPDLTKSNCTKCLNLAYGDLSRWCPEMKGCLYLGPSCSVRYDIVPFSQSIVTDSPAPQPSPQTSSINSATNTITSTTTTTKGTFYGSYVASNFIFIMREYISCFLIRKEEENKNCCRYRFSNCCSWHSGSWWMYLFWKEKAKSRVYG